MILRDNDQVDAIGRSTAPGGSSGNLMLRLSQAFGQASG
jgi:hypothetical protein